MSDAPADIILVFNDDVQKEQLDQYAKEITDGGGEVKEWFTPILNGFSASVKPSQLQSFRSDKPIKYIEGDQTVSIQPV